MKKYNQREIISFFSQKENLVKRVLNKTEKYSAKREKMKQLLEVIHYVYRVVSHNQFKWNDFVFLLRDEIDYCKEQVIENSENLFKHKREIESERNLKVNIMIKLILENILSKYTD